MVEIENTQMLIITAKFGLLDYLRKLLRLIDVRLKEPERIIEINQIERAGALEIAGIVSQFIDALTDVAEKQLGTFTDDVNPIKFNAPDDPDKGAKRSPDPDADRWFRINRPEEDAYDPYHSGEDSARRGRESGATESLDGSAGARLEGRAVPATPTPAPTAPRQEESAESTGWFD